MDAILSGLFDEVRKHSLLQTSENIIVCVVYAFNMNAMLKKIKLLCQKYPKLNSNLLTINAALSFLENNCPKVGIYDAKTQKVNLKAASLWAKQNTMGWEIVSGIYSQLKLQVCSLPDAGPAVQAKNKAWVNAHLDEVLCSEAFKSTNITIRETLSDPTISVSDQNDLWDFLDTIIDNIIEETDLVNEILAASS